MTQLPEKLISLWTEKHEKYCLKFGITGAAQKLWCYLVQHVQMGEEIIFNLQEFNAFVAKERGKGYDPKHLKAIFKKLEDNWLIRVVRQFNWHEYVLILKPLSWLEAPKKKVGKKSENRTIPLNEAVVSTENQEKSLTPNDVFSQQQQEILSPSSDVANDTENVPKVHVVEKVITRETKREIKNLCYQFAIKLPDMCEIYFYPVEEVQIALEFLRIRESRRQWKEGRMNRIGFLIECLRGRWWDEEENKWMLQNKGIINRESPYYNYYGDAVGEATPDEFVQVLRVITNNESIRTPEPHWKDGEYYVWNWDKKGYVKQASMLAT